MSKLGSGAIAVFHFQFGVLGGAQIDRTLASCGEALEDMRPAWDILADRFAGAQKRQFKSEGAAGGDAWSPLSPKYAAWKMKHFPGQDILQLEGHLIRQLTMQPFGVDVREMNFAIFGTALPYAVYHQKGEGDLPRRLVISLTNYEKRAWVKVIQQYLHDAMKTRVEAQFPLKKMVVKEKK